MLEENVEDNYSARVDTCSYESCRETHCNARLDSGVRNISRPNTMHGKTLAAVTSIEKHLLMLDARQSQWAMKSRSRTLGHGGCLKRMWRIITMQSMTLAAVTATENTL